MNKAKRRSFPAFAVLALLSLCLPVVGCSDGGTGLKKELEPLVGTWRARALVLTSVANPEIKVKLIQDWNATFTMSVLATGQYSASLAAFGQSNTEAGTIEVSGDQVTITPTSPPGPSTTGTFSIQAKVLVVDGQTQYDFSWGTEDALVHMELEQVES